MIHNLGLLTAAYLTAAAVLVIELAIAAKIDKRKRGRAVARPM